MKRYKSESPFSLFAFQDIITSVCGIIVLITLLLMVELSMRVLTTKTEQTVSAEEYDKLKSEYEEAEGELREMKDALSLEEQKFKEIPDDLKNKDIEEITETTERLANENENLRTQNEEMKEQCAEKENELAEKQKEKDEFEEQTELLQSKKDRLENELAKYNKEIKKLKDGYSVIYKNSDRTRKPYLVEVSGSVIKATLISETERDVREFRYRKKDTIDLGNDNKIEIEDYILEFSDWAHKKNSNEYFFVLAIRPSGIFQSSRLRILLEDDYRIGIDMITENQNIEVE